MLNKHLIIYVNSITLSKLRKNIKYSNNVNNCIDYKKFNIFFIDLTNINKYTTYRSFQFFNLNYLKNIFQINLKEKSINALNTLPTKLSNYILFKTKHMHYKNYNIKYFNEIAFLFVINVWLKNSKNICKYIKNKLDNVHFKKHRRYFLFFIKILKTFVKPLFKHLNIKGLKLMFRGKLGKGGNARKRVITYKEGEFSLSNKMLAVNFNKWDVWTKTGTVGCSMYIFYNFYEVLPKSVYNRLPFNFN